MTAPGEEISRFLLKPILQVALVVASPFLALSFLFFLLKKPAVWSLVPLSVGVTILMGAVAVWLVVRARIRRFGRDIERLADNDFPRAP